MYTFNLHLKFLYQWKLVGGWSPPHISWVGGGVNPPSLPPGRNPAIGSRYPWTLTTHSMAIGLLWPLNQWLYGLLWPLNGCRPTLVIWCLYTYFGHLSWLYTWLYTGLLWRLNGCRLMYCRTLNQWLCIVLLWPFSGCTPTLATQRLQAYFGQSISVGLLWPLNGCRSTLVTQWL